MTADVMIKKTPPANGLALLDDLLAKARRAGADAADAVLVDSASLSVAWRLGETERLERSESADLGLRVFVGKRQAIVSSADRSPEGLAALVERAVAMARVVPEDPYCGLADPDEITRDFPELDLYDPTEPSSESLIAACRLAEDTARAVPGITNSNGAGAGWSRSAVAIAASNGFAGTYHVSHSSLSVSMLAGSGTDMQTDYDYSSTVYIDDLTDPVTLGRSAADLTLRRLHPRKVKTCKVPVLFEPRASRSMLGHLSSVITGPAIARGTSFLKDCLGKQIFHPSISVIDDPFIKRGLRSHPFDGEGLAPQRRAIIDQGVLTTWLLDLRSARQLGMQSTAHASRGTSSPPSPGPSNLFMTAGKRSAKELIGDVQDGLYVTEMMGSSVNGVTGDYSRGASGFWIENGEIAYPVSEITIAGNLKDMFLAMEAANDLEMRYGIDAPTLRIDGMTVAGK